MNYIRHLTGFFERAATDNDLSATHISLYMSIFQLWNVNRFKNPISLSRSELMELSKVSSKTTYHKCMKDLQRLGYLRYDPSHHPLRGSWVHLFDFNGALSANQSKNCPSSEQALDKSWTSTGQVVYKSCPETHDSKGSPRPLNVFKHNKHIKHNKLSLERPVANIQKMQRERNELANEKNKGSVTIKNTRDSPGGDSCKTSREPAQNSSVRIPENENQVINFFLESGYEKVEATKFFKYYSATGWKVGGRAPIENWRDAADGWILKAKNAANNEKSIKSSLNAGRLHTQPNKNYSEPL